MMARWLAAGAVLALLAGCEAQEQASGGTTPEPATSAGAADTGQPATPEPEATASQQTPEELAALRAAEDAPRIYMALQPDPGRATSVVFAIDQARDSSPLNDPAIRLTPEEGECNPQELRGYPFPLAAAKRPVFGPEEAKSGISARDLPGFMASAVTAEMLRQGLITDPEQSQPQNVCTRKLWERLIINQSTG